MPTNNKKCSSKCSKKHTTFIDAAIPIIESLESMLSVRTYVLGVITQKGQFKHVKVSVQSGGLRIKVIGGGASQEIWAYPHNKSLEQLVTELQNQQDKWEGYRCEFL